MSAADHETEWARRQRREAERAEWLTTHENRCEICGNPPKSRGLSQDHDHRTNRTRGWLDHRCNRALPSWVTPWWLIRAAVYLIPSAEPDPRLLSAMVDLMAAIHDHPETTVPRGSVADLEART